MIARCHIASSAAACLLTAIFVSACGKVDATEHARQGNEYFDQEKYAEAIVEFRGALQEDPKLGAVRLKLGDSYIRTKDFRNALREYVRAADLLPNDIDAQVKAGELLLMAGAFEDVKARADAALALDPKHTKAQILRGNALAGLKDLDGAMSEFEQAVAIDPTETGAYASIGALQFAKGRIEDAEATFKKAVETAPESVEALLGLANFYWASKRPQESEEAMKSALLIDPKNVVANRALGLLYMGTGRANEAEPFFVAIANASSDAAGKLALADYYAMVKRPEDSRKLLRELSGEEASYAVATTRLAALDAAAGNRAQAQAILHELLGKHPKDAPALLLHARLLVADNKREDALAPLKTVIAGDPGSPAAAQAYFISGQVHASTDRIKEAIESFEQVLKLQPRPLAADLALARLHLATGATDKSMTYAQQALAIQPDNPDARALLIRNYVRRGERAKAKEDLAVLQKAFPSSPGVHNLEALIHLANRELDAARASYTRTIQLSPNDTEATAGLLGLDIATGHAKEASARLDEGLSRGTPTASALLLAARTYAMAGDAAKTETALRQAIEVDPSRSQAYGMLGRLYFSQKRLAEAEESFREVTRRNPNSMAAGTMLGMLLQQAGKRSRGREGVSASPEHRRPGGGGCEQPGLDVSRSDPSRRGAAARADRAAAVARRSARQRHAGLDLLQEEHAPGRDPATRVERGEGAEGRDVQVPPGHGLQTGGQLGQSEEVAQGGSLAFAIVRWRRRGEAGAVDYRRLKASEQRLMAPHTVNSNGTPKQAGF